MTTGVVLPHTQMSWHAPACSTHSMVSHGVSFSKVPVAPAFASNARQVAAAVNAAGPCLGGLLRREKAAWRRSLPVAHNQCVHRSRVLGAHACAACMYGTALLHECVECTSAGV